MVLHRMVVDGSLRDEHGVSRKLTCTLCGRGMEAVHSWTYDECYDDVAALRRDMAPCGSDAASVIEVMAS